MLTLIEKKRNVIFCEDGKFYNHGKERAVNVKIELTGKAESNISSLGTVLSDPFATLNLKGTRNAW